MAAISSIPTTTTALTPPSSSHGDEGPWGYSRGHTENTMQNSMHDKTAPMRTDHNSRSPFLPQNGNINAASYSHPSGFEMAARRMHSADNLSSARWDKSTEPGALSPALAIESNMGRASPADWSVQGTKHNWEDQKRPLHQDLGLELTDQNSKWIHRDKLAKIESAELQAAGIFVPRPRAPSKQREPRSNSRLRKAPDSELDLRPRKDSATLDQQTLEDSSPVWDLRTPEEIEEEMANAYFASNSLNGGTRIPVAKASPAPIPFDFLERGSPALRRHGESFDGDSIAYPKTRARSASATLRDPEHMGSGGALRGGKRSMTDMSPKKPGARKMSGASKNGTPTRPKTRSGSKDLTASGRPSTRSGEAASKSPEGEPPWMINAYKPDPRLPPDQQLLPTVARRLQQEKWEKEGKFGDVYDTEFRPLNDNTFLRPSEAERPPTEEESQQHSSEWPLKPGVAKSPPLRQGSYSTMPKISDKPPLSPMPSPRTPGTTQMSSQMQPMQTEEPQSLPGPEESEKKEGGCGCCVVM